MRIPGSHLIPGVQSRQGPKVKRFPVAGRGLYVQYMLKLRGSMEAAAYYPKRRFPILVLAILALWALTQPMVSSNGMGLAMP
jgi:hypothetical protein